MVRQALVHADELRQGDVHTDVEVSGSDIGDEYLMYFTGRLAS
jgi:hypothetical protein